MVERCHLLPQIRRVELAQRDGKRPVVRYQLTVDTGTVDGKRKQLRRRYRTEKEARAELAKIQGPSRRRDICTAVDTHRRASVYRLAAFPPQDPADDAAGYEAVLQPVQSELGALAIQDLTRRHIDDLIVKVRSDQLVRPGG